MVLKLYSALKEDLPVFQTFNNLLSDRDGVADLINEDPTISAGVGLAGIGHPSNALVDRIVDRTDQRIRIPRSSKRAVVASTSINLAVLFSGDKVLFGFSRTTRAAAVCPPRWP